MTCDPLKPLTMEKIMPEDIWQSAPPAPASGSNGIKVRIQRFASGLCAAKIVITESALDEHFGGALAGDTVAVKFAHAGGKRLVAIAMDGDTHDVGKGYRGGGAVISFGVLEGMLREGVPATPMRIVDAEAGVRVVLEIPSDLYGETSDA